MNSATQSFLGRYRLVKVLGQGAMGVVYEAVDTRLGRTVAIKTVLRSHMADESSAAEYASRFEREAQAAARLSHPHVVTVYDFGEHEDISYIVMEFVRGRELNQIFESGEKFSLAESIRIMCELLQALDYAHQQGVVHRDVKPANVLIDGTGRVKLTDFGVARVTNAGQDRTMPGTLVGTPSYMSPEQILGLAVGSRADIFAAGVILYQFLTGKRPFSGGGPFGVQRKIVQDDPDPPSQLNTELPAGFDEIIARALAKQPDNRYESAAIFAADLERIAATLPRDVPLIDLDFSKDSTNTRPFTATPARQPTATAMPVPTAAAPAPTAASVPVAAARPPAPPAPPAPSELDTAPPADPLGITLIAEVPFGGPAPPPKAQAPAPPVFDPESTVIMTRPGTPLAPAGHATQSLHTNTRPVATPPAAAPGPGLQTARPAAVAAAPSATSATATGRLATARPQPAAPAAGSAVGRTFAASPEPTHAASPPRETSAMPTRPAAAVPQRAAMAPLPTVARAPAARPPAPPTRSPLLPMAAGAGVAAVALGLWLAVGKPGMRKPADEGYQPPAASAPALGQGTSPVEPAGASAAAAAALPASAPVAVNTPPVTPPPVAPVADPQPDKPSGGGSGATVAADSPTADAAAGTARTPKGQAARKPTTDAAKPVPRNDGRGNGLEPRCADLLQRMQLGEPLSAEQTSFFQTRCTR